MRWLKQSTTVTVQVGPYLDSTDGVTAETALSPTIEISKAGAVFAARNSATAIAHDADGWYRVELDATDTATLGPLMLKGTETGALPVWHEFMVVTANVYDSIIGGSDTLDVQVTGIAAGAITAAAIATDAIGAAELAADAVAEIADAVWDEATTGHVTAGTFGEQVKTDVDAILADTGTDGVVVATNNDKTGYALSAAGVDAILDDSLTELAAVPAAAPTLRQALQFVFMMARNKLTTTATQMKVHNDAGTAVATATVSDDGTTFERSEFA